MRKDFQQLDKLGFDDVRYCVAQGNNVTNHTGRASKKWKKVLDKWMRQQYYYQGVSEG